MAVNEAVEPKPLAKRAALEYLEDHGQATAKELAIDRDSRAATASELLERCSSQGLIERDEKERPRVYRLTGPGRERLEVFRSQDTQQVLPTKTSNPCSKNPSVSNQGSNREDQAKHETVDVECIKEEFRLQLQSLREDMRDFIETLGLNPSRGEEELDVPSKVDKLRGRLKSLAEKNKETLAGEALVNLYRADHALTDPQSGSMGKVPTKEDVAALERQVGKDAAEKLARLVELEGELDGRRYREALRLRRELNLPGEVMREVKLSWLNRK